jgi:ribulose-phosphate 3-epimerase
VTPLPLDVHLMISEPERYVDRFRDAGADMLIVHVETARNDLSPLLRKIRNLGAGVGISLNPSTPVTVLGEYLDQVDLVLVMSVPPGFGGQKFQPGALERLRWLSARIRPGVLLSVDGGLNTDTIGPAARAGARVFVVGSALFGQKDHRRGIADLTAIATSSIDRN